MKKIVDILILLVIVLILFSFYTKGWTCVAFAVSAIITAVAALILNKKL